MYKRSITDNGAKRIKRNAKGSRGEISTPIITILVTVAALAVTAMAISWMASTGSIAANQGAIVIIGSPAAQNNNLYLTLKNIGTANATISSCVLGSMDSTTVSPTTIPAGESVAVTISFVSSFASGQTLKGSLLTDQGTIQFSAFTQ